MTALKRTPAMNAEIISMLEQGESQAAIMRQFGFRSASPIRRVMKQHFGPDRPPRRDPNEERDKRILDLRSRGLTFGQIGAKVGMSRHAVSGVVRRHKRTLASNEPEKPPEQPKEKPKEPQRDIPDFVDAERVGPISAPTTCQWPMWSNKADYRHPDFGKFCGEPTVPGKPYCFRHCARAFTGRK